MDSFEKYYTLSLRYLALRPRSEKEVIDYLNKKHSPKDIILQVITKLKTQRFLNDELYAKMWVEARARGKPRSKWLLSRELKDKGVGQDIVEKVLSETKEVVSDFSLAKEAIGKRIAKYRSLPRHEIYQKVGGFLARRGFSWEISKRAIDDFLKEGYNKDE